MKRKSNWEVWHSLLLTSIVISIVLIGVYYGDDNRFLCWIATMILFTMFVVVAGHGITGLWRGLFIDRRNEISLSRFQMVFWTVIVLSGYFSIVLANIALGWSNPLAVAIPEEVWLAMGISTTSLIGGPLISRKKRSLKADDHKTAITFNLLYEQGVNPSTLDTEGQIVIKKKLTDSSWSALFRGEESNDAAHLDLTRIQMFFFTIILLLAYILAIGSLLKIKDIRIESLPEFNTSMLALMGLSHGSYLVSKAIPQPSPK